MYWRARHFKRPQGENITTDMVNTVKFVVAHEKRRHITIKENIPMWSPAHFAGGYRKKDNVQQLHWFVADVDDGSDYFVTVDKLKRAQWLFFAHCTWSWTPSLHKFRVALPLEEPIKAADWPVCWDRAADWFENFTGCTLDITTKDSSRAYAVSAHQNRQLPPFTVTDGYHLNLLAACREEIEEQARLNAIKEQLRARQAQLNSQKKTEFQQDNQARNQDHTLTDADRLAIANKLGARIDGQYAKGIICPQCQRRSLWFSMVGYQAHCNHRNSCGFKTQIKHL
jgi:hypothetical protein